jgi:hypothetical protein
MTPGMCAVSREAGQRAVDHGFVTLLVWVVADLHGHDHDATPRRGSERKRLPGPDRSGTTRSDLFPRAA